MKCENCGLDHDGSYASGRFCCEKCARGFSTKNNKDYINKKRSISNKIMADKLWQNDEYREKMKLFAKKAYALYLSKYDENLLKEDFSKLKGDRIKKRVLLEQDYKCNRCNISKWEGEKLVLELEHKNGNHCDNNRNNLECLCPNCHSLTPTFRGRNKKGRRPFTSSQQIIEAFIETGNIRQTLLKLGLAAKGNNYKRVKQTLTIKGIDYKLID